MATSARISETYGYSPTDATVFLQAALNDNTFDTIIIDLQPTDWVAGPLFVNRSNLTIVLENGVVLRSLEGSLGEFESQLSIIDRENIVIEGSGATIRGDKENYPQDSEFRHCIHLLGARNINITGLQLERAAGDGLFIDSGYTNGVPSFPCENITIEQVVMNDNNRQGCSVSDVIGLLMTGCSFLNTRGTLPEAGIDFEPFETSQHLQGIFLKNCRFEGNYGPGILVACVDLDDTSPLIDIVIDGGTVRDNCGANPTGGDAVLVSNKFRADGRVEFRNLSIEDEPCTAITIQKYATTLSCNFTDVTLTNVAYATTDPLFAPIFISPVNYNQPDDDPFGGVRFENVLLNDERDRTHFIAAQLTSDGVTPSEPGVADLTGSITICTPPGINVQTELGPAPAGGNTLTFPDCSSLPVATEEITGVLLDCKHLITAAFKESGQNGYLVLEASFDGENWVEAVRAQLPAETSRTDDYSFVVDGEQSRLYRLRFNLPDGTEDIYRLISIPGCNEKSQLMLWPNPATERLWFLSEDRVRTFLMFDGSGRLLKRCIVPANVTSVSVERLPRGNYWLYDNKRATPFIKN